MEWSPRQANALEKVAAWLNDPSGPQVFRIFGYAGTGKTTLAKHFAESVKGTVLFAAFTGKAAHVLRQKGCEGASTIHSLIYRSKDRSQARLKELEASLTKLMAELRAENPDANLEKHDRVIHLRKLLREERDASAHPFFTLNPESPVRDARLLVIDECSMVDEAMGKDMLSFGTKVLVLGDPAQLPPIMGGGFFTNGKPDVMLTEIHRQAKDNPIIWMASEVREQRGLKPGAFGSSRVLKLPHGEKLAPDDALGADQVLVGRNATRSATNQRFRTLLGYPERQPTAGDKVVCLRNDHEVGLLNGALWYVKDAYDPNDDEVSLVLQPEPEGGEELCVLAHMHYFLHRKEKLDWWRKKDAQEFDYGYALTVHKAQGSQWDNVVIFDESTAFRDDRWRWLYTGLTRAAEKITVVL